MVPGKTLTEKANKLRRWGFDAISLQIPSQERSDALMEEILGLEENTGLCVCEFSYIGDHFGQQMCNDASISAAALSDQMASIDMCSRLNAGNALGFEYTPRDPLPLFDAQRAMPEDTESRFIDLLNKVGAYAKERNVVLCVEGINRYETRYGNRLGEIKGYLQKTRPELNLGILADFFHMSIEESNIEEAILENGAYIKHVHLGENNRLLPGCGSINWEAGFRALKKVGYDGYLALECGVPGEPDVLLPECLAFLRRCLQRC